MWTVTKRGIYLVGDVKFNNGGAIKTIRVTRDYSTSPHDRLSMIKNLLIHLRSDLRDLPLSRMFIKEVRPEQSIGACRRNIMVDMLLMNISIWSILLFTNLSENVFIVVLFSSFTVLVIVFIFIAWGNPSSCQANKETPCQCHKLRKAMKLLLTWKLLSPQVWVIFPFSFIAVAQFAKT